MVALSCTTPPKESKPYYPIEYTEAKKVTTEVHRPGVVTHSEYPLPGSELLTPAGDLKTDFIKEKDIKPETAMEAAVTWAGQYHDLARSNNILIGWVLGVNAATKNTKNSLTNPETTSTPEKTDKEQSLNRD